VSGLECLTSTFILKEIGRKESKGADVLLQMHSIQVNEISVLLTMLLYILFKGCPCYQTLWHAPPSSTWAGLTLHQAPLTSLSTLQWTLA
jgi:hypothetical protein